jgi:hypothetical protein
MLPVPQQGTGSAQEGLHVMEKSFPPERKKIAVQGLRQVPLSCRVPPSVSLFQHFSSQVEAARLSGPACTWHRSAQALHAVYCGLVVTSVQIPPLASQRAYCRHLSPVRYSSVQICGAFVPHARSVPWQVVNPQMMGDGVSAGMVAGTVVGSGVGVAFVPPGNTDVQPAEQSAATSRTMHRAEMADLFFMEDRVSGDIRRGLYLWVYFTAEFLGVIPVNS